MAVCRGLPVLSWREIARAWFEFRSKHGWVLVSTLIWDTPELWAKIGPWKNISDINPRPFLSCCQHHCTDVSMDSPRFEFNSRAAYFFPLTFLRPSRWSATVQWLDWKMIQMKPKAPLGLFSIFSSNFSKLPPTVACIKQTLQRCVSSNFFFTLKTTVKLSHKSGWQL